MTHYQLKCDQRYADVFDRIVVLLHAYKKEHAKSPTIAQIASIIGDSEEMVLESIEFGRYSPQQSPFLH
ncbi:sigmaB [Alkalihalophilus pseudofirmus OF4]|uniref:SigmaB n=2 Tax=Alkalihalophilus pseudofirmus TaxID=79885 RepID=D3FYQ8_ALKPO|nr:MULTISPECIES: hypothetical protein [Alkalihalophilus]ADC50910.1 sigmaB [Alkalihalophilus pseudofirmus OF4]MDV2884105.1 hypothetical protein [Alkalihalophilus pseudofirmus]MED1601284.1 hypothetical protein [Alkalihalophilus marmarensis]OLS35959.1 hypothetical protein BTR22_13290 [Alkalihalophilus pseudofirmus]WEG18124.1 hypothetical protein PQ478_06460 [Alkalihalophilus pseudofirmus]